jgi:4-amino-4-deoxy-L-arabinose transferase-like glycosyltransferase
MQFYNNNTSINIFLIIIISLSLRAVNLYYFENLTGTFIEDSADYYSIALHAEKNGLTNWLSHSRPPLISLTIIPILKIFDQSLSIIFIKFLMIFISISTCIALYFLTLEISKNKKISFITSFIYSFYPFSIFFSGRLLTENLASLLICLISIFFIKFIDKRNLKYLLISSFLLGLLSLTRSAYYYLPVFLSVFIFFINISFLKKIFSILMLIFIFFITLSPWIIKNYVQLDEIVPTTTRLGYGLWLSNNDFSSEIIQKGGYEKTQKFEEGLNYSNKFDNPIKSSDYLKKKALVEIQNHKFIFIKSCIFRFLNFFNPKPNPYKSLNSKDLVMIIFFSPFLVFFFISLIKKNHNLKQRVLLIIIIYSLLVHMPFYGFPRFRFPVDSLIFLLSINFLFEKINFKALRKLLS